MTEIAWGCTFSHYYVQDSDSYHLIFSTADVGSGTQTDIALEAQDSKIVCSALCHGEALTEARCNLKLHPVAYGCPTFSFAWAALGEEELSWAACTKVAPK